MLRVKVLEYGVGRTVRLPCEGERNKDHSKPMTLAECKCAAAQSFPLKRAAGIISGEPKKQKSFFSLSLRNFASSVRAQKKSLQDVETRPANGQARWENAQGRGNPRGA